ncbi:MAG: aspartyl protease family protein [Candidatus Andersenbacteria bacterium]|nr:aspartyl protease family protein [Candidatus Andersenbacteria bacterium]
MRFPYVPERRGTALWHVPRVPVVLHGRNTSVKLHSLVDSGSDHNIFGLDVAHRLRLALANEQPVQLQGFAGGQAEGYLVPIAMTVAGHRFATTAIFTAAATMDAGILGQVDFFSFFVVTFDYQNKLIDIRRPR